MEQQAIWAIGIFLVIYALIISEKVHRTIVAMIGGLSWFTWNRRSRNSSTSY